MPMTSDSSYFASPGHLYKANIIFAGVVVLLIPTALAFQAIEWGSLVLVPIVWVVVSYVVRAAMAGVEVSAESVTVRGLVFKYSIPLEAVEWVEIHPNSHIIAITHSGSKRSVFTYGAKFVLGAGRKRIEDFADYLEPRVADGNVYVVVLPLSKYALGKRAPGVGRKVWAPMPIEYVLWGVLGGLTALAVLATLLLPAT